MRKKKRTRPAQLKNPQLPKKKSARQVTKEVVVIPHWELPDTDGMYHVPMGEKMRQLVANKLTGIIRFSMVSNAEEIRDQIEMLFGKFEHSYLKVSVCVYVCIYDNITHILRTLDFGRSAKNKIGDIQLESC